jgi:D-amino-acid dehydrogenase
MPMDEGSNTIVIGGGLIGLATAWELVSRGEPVTVVEAREDVGLEASFANGGMLTASMADPWNAPGIYRQLAISLFDPHSPMKVRLHAVPGLVHWGLKFLRNSRPSVHRDATRASYLLAANSIARLRELRTELSLEYHADASGTMKVFRTDMAMAGSLAVARDLANLGLRFETLTGAGAVAAEPQLAPIADRITGALLFPADESGDALQFCRTLKAHILRCGGEIRTGQRVSRLVSTNNVISGVVVGNERLAARRVVVAAGNGTRRLVFSTGLSLPIAPAKGYSITVQRNGLGDWPRLPVVDDDLHAAVVPIGDRLRIAGTAEFTGEDTRITRERIDMLFNLLDSVYPHISRRVDRGTAHCWAGLRPMSADGLPFVGATNVSGLYVNAGHGHLGWTLAMGSAHLLADLIAGREPDIDPGPYRPGR